MQVVGIDFSGARDAARRIWIASGVVAGSKLKVIDCIPAAELPRASCGQPFVALTSFIEGLPTESVIGIDAPFGLPAGVTHAASWRELVESFPADYADADSFRATCLGSAGGRELRRETDAAARTPFCAYNLRLYRQTYHVLRDVLSPLVTTGGVSVAPMQERSAGRRLVVEVCPASTLKNHGLYVPYKGRRLRSARGRILNRLVRQERLSVPPAVAARVLGDAGGDALDSLVAAAAARRAARSTPTPPGTAWSLEGFVYV